MGTAIVNVLVAWNIRPVLCQHLLAVGIVLDLPYDLMAGSLEPEVEAADTAEQTAYAHQPHFSSSEGNPSEHCRVEKSISIGMPPSMIGP